MIVLSIGGSLIAPTDHSGKTIGHIEGVYLKKFRELILKYVRRGQRFIIVTGGGGPSRSYAKAALALNPKAKEVDRHWIGIAATKLNAEFFRVLFSPYSHPAVLGDPTVRVNLDHPVAIAAGWLPGHSTDKDAVVLGKTYHAKRIFNLTNVDYVYSGDPRYDKHAVAYPELTWKQYKKILGMKTFKPSAHAPFDPVAAAFAQRHGLTVTVMDGGKLANLKNALEGKAFAATTLHP
ncbi:hypothetical protein HZA86_05040 [Candidatus Uhrbacteria bacterium]|nr:hypothetical protein [Candidatus Uhrbacteria bacterium]